MTPERRIRIAKGRIAKILLHQEGELAWRIDWLQVPPEDRGCGLARKLMDLVLAEADSEGVALTLVSNASGAINAPDNRKLEAFYASFGFCRTGEHDEPHGGPVMARYAVPHNPVDVQPVNCATGDPE